MLKVKIHDNMCGIKTVEMVKDNDGWYVGDGYAVSLELNICQTYPWFGDGFCTAPQHKFEVVGED